MIRNAIRKHLNRTDSAISPVIGTILMVAATVIIGGAVYAAVNAYSGKAAKPATDAAYKAQALDTDGNGKEDTIKNADPRVTVTGASWGTGTNTTTSWSPGDFSSYAGNAGTVYVTVSMGGSTVLDQTLQLKE
jgi:flagellin-like protein